MIITNNLRMVGFFFIGFIHQNFIFISIMNGANVNAGEKLHMV